MNAPDTLGCVYLCYNENDQGGHECLHLMTNQIITRPKVTPIPITSHTIHQVQAIAEEEKMPQGLNN